MQEKEHDKGHICGKLEEDGLRQSEMERTGAIPQWDVGQSEGMCTLQCVHVCAHLRASAIGLHWENCVPAKYRCPSYGIQLPSILHT